MATVIGTNGNDVLFGTSGDDQIFGLDGNDRLQGGTGANHLFGGAGNDALYNSSTFDDPSRSVLEGGAGADWFLGSGGFVLASYAGSSAGVTVDLKTGLASGGDAQGDVFQKFLLDGLIGSAFNDVLTGSSIGYSELQGGAGDDILTLRLKSGLIEGGAGADRITGVAAFSGGGISIASYASSAAGVSVDLVAGTGSGGDAQGDVLTNIQGLIGSTHDDILKAAGGGGPTVDISADLRGGAGNDTLDIAAAASGGVMEGGTGADTLIGRISSVDTYIATYEHSAAAVTVDLGTGHGSGGDAEGDVLQSVDTVEGSAFGDVLVGRAGAERLTGKNGDDHLYGSAGADDLDGGAGVDTVDYSRSAGPVTVNFDAGSEGDAAGDRLYNIEILIGSSHDDVMTGSNPSTSFDDGTDVVEGGVGADTLDGRGGIDTASYAHSAAAVTVSFATGLTSGGDAQGDTLTNFENLRGSAFADTLVGDTGSNTFEGGAGADALYGGAGSDTASYAHSGAGVQVELGGIGIGGDAAGDTLNSIENLIGSDHDDILKAGHSSSTLSGGAGDDILRASQGNQADIFDGGVGFDMVLYTNAHVVVDLQLGTGLGGAQDDFFISIEGLTGGGLNDSLTGNAADNIFYGLDDNDTLSGRDGADILSGGTGADQLDGGAGSDIASYYTGILGVAVNLTTGTASGGDAQGDTLTSIEGLSGSNLANDSLAGNAGANTLRGWGGDDALTGAGGKDTLIGGAGADRFIYGSTADSVVGVNADVIADFNHSQGDRIDLSVIDANTGAAGNQAFSFIGTAAYTGVAGQLRYHSDGAVTTIAGDVNGDGVSDFHIQLTGAIGLVAGDFVL
jgi:Ca2+-binding RTX toxin-like protein